MALSAAHSAIAPWRQGAGAKQFEIVICFFLRERGESVVEGIVRHLPTRARMDMGMAPLHSYVSNGHTL